MPTSRVSSPLNASRVTPGPVAASSGTPLGGAAAGGGPSREREVLIHVARGMTNAAIARALWLSNSSVKAHVSRILIKLRCDSRLLAALMAHDAGLINRP